MIVLFHCSCLILFTNPILPFFQSEGKLTVTVSPMSLFQILDMDGKTFPHLITTKIFTCKSCIGLMTNYFLTLWNSETLCLTERLFWINFYYNICGDLGKVCTLRLTDVLKTWNTVNCQEATNHRNTEICVLKFSVILKKSNVEKNWQFLQHT